MDDRGRHPTLRRRRFQQLVVLLAAWACVSGCVGPTAVRYTRLRYNEVVRYTTEEQLLINIVRLRYADSPIFIDLPNITSQFQMAGGGNYLGGYGNQSLGRASIGNGMLSLSDTPTLSYHPREGTEIAKALLTPLSADLFSVVNAGANIEQLLLFCMDDINDVPNAPGATTLVPLGPDDNQEFVRGIQLISSLRKRGVADLAYATTEESDDASDPIPKGAVTGRDVLNATQAGYVYRTRPDGQLVVLKWEKRVLLPIREESPDVDEMRKIFHLTKDSSYWIESDVSEKTNKNKPPIPLTDEEGHDTLYLNMRSILQIMTFLSKGVCVPDAHAISGVAPMTPDPDGQPYDWSRGLAGNFVVHAQKHRPRNAELAVPYRGYWFYVAANDAKSRSVLAILEVVFALQESDGASKGPILTLPIGGK
jgi:hypothetical protein